MERAEQLTVSHIPVLCKEAIESLQIKESGTYVDLTFGRGGHSAEILRCLGAEGRLIAVDQDKAAIDFGRKFFKTEPRFTLYHASFAQLQELLTPLGLMGQIDGILFDLGVSSPQLDESERGFSFKRKGPLDMRMNTAQYCTAATWLNSVEEKEIARVLWLYGEERQARRIAAAIVAERKKGAIQDTLQLSTLIERTVTYRGLKKHPATRTFQALRIVVNDELAVLKRGLCQATEALAPKGRMAVISFHSLEDRIVKDFFHVESHGPAEQLKQPIVEHKICRRLRRIGGLLRPSAAEIASNTRARSARLRVAEKLI